MDISPKGYGSVLSENKLLCGFGNHTVVSIVSDSWFKLGRGKYVSAKLSSTLLSWNLFWEFLYYVLNISKQVRDEGTKDQNIILVKESNAAGGGGGGNCGYGEHTGPGTGVCPNAWLTERVQARLLQTV